MNQIVTDMLKALNQKPTNEIFGLLQSLNAKPIGYSDDNNTLEFKVKGDKGINYVKVSFDMGQDLYNVELGTIRKFAYNKKDEIKGLFWDNIVDAIWRRVVIV